MGTLTSREEHASELLINMKKNKILTDLHLMGAQTARPDPGHINTRYAPVARRR